MAKSARQSVFEGMELLPEVLTPFIEKRLENALKGHWEVEVATKLRLRPNPKGGIKWDQASILNTIDRYWDSAFKSVLGRTERALVNELVEVRNKLAHNEKFTYDDAERALDSMRRLLQAIGSGQATDQLDRLRNAILRTKFSELQRNEQRRRTVRQGISVETTGGLLPWRQVVEPHEDIATGEFLQAEFAADLGKVHSGSAPEDYRDPRTFFDRTYLTDGLRALLIGTAKRLSNSGGDPVIELQTGFGGGKTHSMLALYHMTGKIPARDLSGLDQLLSEHRLTVPTGIHRAVLVGTSRGPQDLIHCEDGRKICTTWGEMAWQLGGPEAFDRIAENDAKGIAPGSNLLESIFRDYAPSLILIDEWVAYLRQIYRTDNLPSGTFDANLSFVQSLTEAVKASPGTMLVAALPASQIEVGGEGGNEALTRLKLTFSRVESSWRPASQEESYEIVRQRLFKEIPGDRYHHRDNTLSQFAKLYRDNSNEFPRGSSDEDYRRKMEKAYPIHPELFDQLYMIWGSLERFQRTRGVLRLMAQAVHELWMSKDDSVVIMPSSIAVGSDRIEPELRHYLDVSWQSIIAGDIDGRDSIPYKIDQSAPNLSRYSATCRVARAIFMGTAPVSKQENRGLDDKQINLGVVQPGERPSIFGDALRRLNNQARFLHSDLGRYWYSMSASLNRLAADRAEQMEEELVVIEIDKALSNHINSETDRGHFDAVQVAPGNSGDVPDEAGGVRAVVFGVAHPHHGREGSKGLEMAKNILSHRGRTPRIYRNMLVFFVADARQTDTLKVGMRNVLAWSSIVQDTEHLDLTQRGSALAKAKFSETKETLKARIKETWRYLAYPVQNRADAEVEWVWGRISAQDGIFRQASKRLENEEALLTELGPERLNRELQKYIWNDQDHLSLRDIWEYVNRYTYLPRLKNRSVLIRTVDAALGSTVPGPFAYAESYDEGKSSYQGLVIRSGIKTQVVIDSESVIVDPQIAKANLPVSAPDSNGAGEQPAPPEPSPNPDDDNPVKPSNPTRFTGTVFIRQDRPNKHFGDIIEAVFGQLTALPGSEVTLKLEIDAEVPSGMDQGKVRTLIENTNTLDFTEKDIR